MRIGRVAEVKWEVREVCRRLKLERLDARDEIYGATHDGKTICLCLSGMVPALAKERMNRFLDTERLDLMICSGLAGALKPHVRIGELIVQSDDADLVGIAEKALTRRNIRFHVGPLVTVSQPVLTPAARHALAATTSAIAVDMESQTIAKLCRERHISCLAMKGVSDDIDDDLSPILGGFDVINIPRIAIGVVAKPRTWPPVSPGIVIEQRTI